MQIRVDFLLLVIGAAAALGCSSSNPRSSEGSDAGGLPGGPTIAVACTDDPDAVYSLPEDLPPYDATHRGDVVRCAFERTLSRDAIEATLRTDEFVDINVKSPVRVYRIAYRTERLVGREGLTTALVLLPDRPIARHAPVVVAAHGFNGNADACRFSTQFGLTGDSWRPGLNFMGTAIALAGYGYPVIAPDYPGFGTETPATVFSSEDEAHSVLDGTRAMHAILAPKATSEDVVFVGHSQGGHAVLSAQALASSYGMEGRLVAVVPFAPNWMVGRTWGAVISAAAGFTTANNPLLLGLAITYFNSHVDLYDGPGSSLGLYQPSKRDAMRAFADSSKRCVVAEEGGLQGVTEALTRLGTTTSDFFDPAFVEAVGTCGITGNPNCAGGPAATWIERFRADRPAIDPHGADVLLWQGGKDTVATPAFSRCGIDKITADISLPDASAHLSVCGDRTADHETVLSDNTSWTARWIAARTVGAPEPEACPGFDTLQPDDGGTIGCPPVPGNVD